MVGSYAEAMTSTYVLGCIVHDIALKFIVVACGHAVVPKFFKFLKFPLPSPLDSHSIKQPVSALYQETPRMMHLQLLPQLVPRKKLLASKLLHTPLAIPRPSASSSSGLMGPLPDARYPSYLRLYSHDTKTYVLPTEPTPWLLSPGWVWWASVRSSAPRSLLYSADRPPMLRHGHPPATRAPRLRTAAVTIAFWR